MADGGDIGHVALCVKKGSRFGKVSQKANVELVVFGFWDDDSGDVVAADQEVENYSEKGKAD